MYVQTGERFGQPRTRSLTEYGLPRPSAWLGQAPTRPVAREFDGVFEGGGAKGIAFVGALAFMERQGMRFKRVAGTSAGAITAALIAAGYRAGDIERIVFTTNFLQFLDPPSASHFSDEEIRRSIFYKLMPLIPALALLPASAKIALLRRTVFSDPTHNLFFNLMERGGLFAGERFRAWINEKIRARLLTLSPGATLPPSPTFAQLYSITGISLSVIASDIGRRRMLIFNERLTPTVPVADGVRMSMSIPFVYSTVRFNGCPVVDGGVLSNYPMFIFARANNPYLANTPADLSRPKIGFLLDEEGAPPAGPPQPCPPGRVDPVEELKALADTMMTAFDRRATGNYTRDTVRINVQGFSTLQFHMTEPQKRALADRGWQATARHFMSRGIPTPTPSPYR